jgi:hypothetical protein
LPTSNFCFLKKNKIGFNSQSHAFFSSNPLAVFASELMSTMKSEHEADVTGNLTGDLIAPKITDQGKLECPICKRVFNARNEYDEHWVTCHQDEGLSMASGSMGSLNPDGQQSCEKPK